MVGEGERVWFRPQLHCEIVERAASGIRVYRTPDSLFISADVRMQMNSAAHTMELQTGTTDEECENQGGK